MLHHYYSELAVNLRLTGGGGGGGGFFLVCNDCKKMFDNSFPNCTFFSFFFKRRLACAHYFHSLGQDQSTVAQRAEMTDRVFPDELRVSLFLIGSHTMPGQRHSHPTPTSLGKRCMHV